MLPPLSDARRVTLFQLAALTCVSALCLIPFASVSSSIGSPQSARRPPAELPLRLPADSAAALPVALRDPFAASPRAER